MKINQKDSERQWEATGLKVPGSQTRSSPGPKERR